MWRYIYSVIKKVVVNNPLIVNTVTDTVYGFGQVCLSATQNDPAYDVAWYSVPTGGIPVGTGNSYCTNISNTTTFYAQASTAGGVPVVTSSQNYVPTGGANSLPFNVAEVKQVQWFVVLTICFLCADCGRFNYFD
ncbi:MAG: hypothetical protein IPP29_22970 [Bacteroidetes bacterium]|nr:hypothetical protein [Bacteroidota bacterium]